ncbi:hypothetical protein LWS67_16655 [Bacillus atrophaeus]|uniref:hypothetical protein n=1 Tax=Bacillus atrophaeus TaxID=1452 RepID=UPI001EFB65E1|nr:hypothetical protein [Bacillus atrophaeus]MCG8398134.1 hypothetical protein [Bacillus atrophaeus]
MSTTETALTVHLIRSKMEDNDDILHQIAKKLHEQFGIEHPTIQIEKGTFSCKLQPDHKI